MNKVLICLIFALMLLGSFASVQAENVFETANQNLQKGGEVAYGEGTESNLLVVIGRIVNGVLVVSGIILTVIILMGGYKYLTAGGKKDEVDKAKEWIKNGIIGLIIILLAYSISSYVMNQILINALISPTS